MNLYYEEYAGLSKRDTLFIHGNLASHRWWRPTLDAWRRAGPLGDGHLILSDWRGCGHNDEWPAEQTFSLEDLALDQLSLLDRLGIHEVDLVGHSLGGLIALQMMVLEPKLVHRTVLLDSVGATGVVFDESMYAAFKAMAQDRALTQKVILSTIRDAERLDPQFQDELVDDAFKAVRGIGTPVLEILKSVNLAKRLEDVQTPTLILHGAHDQILPQRDAEILEKLLPRALCEILPEQGHCWNLEDPSGFTRRVREWLSV